MRGLLARISRRRPPADAVRPDGQAAPAPTPESTGAAGPGTSSAAGVPLESEVATAPLRPSFRDRGRLRRRLRYLRRVRELGFRDLGGLVFDQHRFDRPGEELVRGKLGALRAVDGELRALEALLDDSRPFVELREPGIAACVRCGALHGSDARFCPSCGAAVSGPRAVQEIASLGSSPSTAGAAAASAATVAASPAAQAAAPSAGGPVVPLAAQSPLAAQTPAPTAAAPALEAPAGPPTDIRPSDAGPRPAAGRRRSFSRLLRRRHAAPAHADMAGDGAESCLPGSSAAERPTTVHDVTGEAPSPVITRDEP